jgi:purine-binding chemotaxis protein CheW
LRASEQSLAGGDEGRPANAPYLTFRLAGEVFAVAVLRVREIIELQTFTRVPHVPQWIRGVINLRGGVVPVVDLAVKFGLAESEITKRTCIVVVEVDLGGGRVVMGVLVDAVSQVVDLPRECVEPPPPFGTRVRVDFLEGIGKVEGSLVLVLDIDRVLSAEEVAKVSLSSETLAQAPPSADPTVAVEA